MGGGLDGGGEKVSSRFSNVIPNTSWFRRNLNKYAKQITKKLDTVTTNSPLSPGSSQSPSTNTTTHQQLNHSSPKLLNQPRKSYHFTRDLTQSNLPAAVQNIPDKNVLVVEKPRKSLRRRSIKKINHRPALPKKLLISSNSSSSPSNCTSSCQIDSPVFTRTSSSSEYGSTPPDTFGHRCKCSSGRVITTGNKNQQFHPELLPPIITKNRHHRVDTSSSTMSSAKQQDLLPASRRISTTTSAGGFKLRTNSPRIANRRFNNNNNNQVGRKIEMSTRRGGHHGHVYESFAVVKTSKDPTRDFRESMVEMIVENNIMGSSKDLEELLACYLSLNSHHYHYTIINVFKQIWLDQYLLHLK